VYTHSCDMLCDLLLRLMVLIVRPNSPSEPVYVIAFVHIAIVQID
jgi:hypothetical protein